MHGTRRRRRTSLVLGLDNIVNDRIEENTTDSDRASNQLDGGKRFTENQGDTDNDDHALGGVGNGLGDGVGLLESHGGKFVVPVEVKTRGNQVHPDGGRGLGQVDEFSETRTFLEEDERDTEEEPEDGRQGELVSDRSDAFLQAFCFHQLLVFVTTDGSKHVGNAGRDESRNGKVKFLHGGEDNTADYNGKAEPLGLGNLLAIDELRKNSGEGGFRSLDDLSERNGAHSHGKDGGSMGTHEAEGHGEHLDNILGGDSGFLTSIGGQPQEDTIQATNTELQGRDGHWETGLSTSGIKGQLVGNVVVVVTVCRILHHNVSGCRGLCKRIFGSHGNKKMPYPKYHNAK